MDRPSPLSNGSSIAISDTELALVAVAIAIVFVLWMLSVSKFGLAGLLIFVAFVVPLGVAVWFVRKSPS